MSTMPKELIDVALALLAGAVAIGMLLLLTILAVEQHTRRLHSGLDRLKERLDLEGRLHQGLAGVERSLKPIENVGRGFKEVKDRRLHRWAGHVPISADSMTLLRPVYLWIGLSRLWPCFPHQADYVVQFFGVFFLCYAAAIASNFARPQRKIPTVCMAVLGGLSLACSLVTTGPWAIVLHGMMGLIALLFDLLDGPKASLEAQARRWPTAWAPKYDHKLGGFPTRHGPYLDPIVDVFCFVQIALGLWSYYPAWAMLPYVVGIGGRIGFSLVYQGFRMWQADRLPRLLPESMAGKYKTAFLAASCLLVMFLPDKHFPALVAAALMALATGLEFISLGQQGVRAVRSWRSNLLPNLVSARAVNE